MSTTHHRLSLLEHALVATLAYSDSFESPLLFEELCQRCLFLPSASDEQRRVTSSEKRQRVKKALEQLKKRSIVQSEVDKAGDMYYSLSGRGELIEKRRTRQVLAEQKQSEIDQVVMFLTKLPWVSAVYLTGSMAMGSATPESDIDFMIVTHPNRLWITRILVSVFAQLQGKRRSWNHEEPGSWCFNLWLDTDHLGVEESKRDVYRAYELLQARLLFDKENTAVCLAGENKWIQQFFYLSKDMPPTQCGRRQPFSLDQLPFFKQLLTLGDFLAWKVQQQYMKRHQTTEKVGRGYAFFHPRDTKKEIFTAWQRSLGYCLPKEHAVAILQPYVSATDPSYTSSLTSSGASGSE